jgi:hypothetical protein
VFERFCHVFIPSYILMRAPAGLVYFGEIRNGLSPGSPLAGLEAALEVGDVGQQALRVPVLRVEDDVAG